MYRPRASNKKEVNPIVNSSFNKENHDNNIQWSHSKCYTDLPSPTNKGFNP